MYQNTPQYSPHSETGCVRRKELYSIHMVKDYLQQNGLDHVTMDTRASQVAWSRPGYLGCEPTPDQVQIYVRMIQEFDSLVTMLTHRINREGLAAWG